MNDEERKQYIREWFKSPAGKESKKKSARRYKETENGRLVIKQYRAKYKKTPKGKEFTRKYRQTKSAKISHAKSNKKQYETHKQQIKARGAVRYAIKTGKLPSISTQICRNCGKIAENYHHDNYDKAHYLDVIPLCRACHVRYHLIASPHEYISG